MEFGDTQIFYFDRPLRPPAGRQLCRRTNNGSAGFTAALVTAGSAPAPDDLAAAPSVRHARYGVDQRRSYCKHRDADARRKQVINVAAVGALGRRLRSASGRGPRDFCRIYSLRRHAKIHALAVPTKRHVRVVSCNIRREAMFRIIRKTRAVAKQPKHRHLPARA